MEETVENPSQLIQPIVAQVNSSNSRAKASLVDRIANLLSACENASSVVNRYVVPLTKTGHKLSQEAQTNPSLRDALRNLETAIAQIHK